MAAYCVSAGGEPYQRIEAGLEVSRDLSTGGGLGPVQAARAGKAGVPTRDPIDANAVVRGGECTPGHRPDPRAGRRPVRRDRRLPGWEASRDRDRRGSGLGPALTIGIGWRDVASTALASVRFTRGNDPPSVGREL